MNRLIILLVFAVAMLGCTATEPHTNDHNAHEQASTAGMADHMANMPSDHMEDMADHMANMPSDHMAGSDDHNDGHGGHGGEGHNSAEPIPGAAEIRVIATEFGFEPATLKLIAGEPINIVLVNEGLLPHELGIKELEFHAHAEAGETVTVGFVPDETGEYEFGCYIAGHYEAGMFGEAIIDAN